MNGFEIHQLISGNKHTFKYYIGCYNNETLPLIPYDVEKYFLVVNTGTDVEKMGHWVLLYKIRKNLLWIDSFGKDPKFYGGRIKMFFHNYDGEKIFVIKKQLQSNTSLVCGAYVLYFSYKLSRENNYKKVVRNFVNDKKFNDSIVETFMFKVFHGNMCGYGVCSSKLFDRKCMRSCFCI